MSPRGKVRGLMVAVLLGLCGCSSARFVVVDGDHGIVSIPSNSNSWPSYNRDAADELLRKRFPQGYVIDREEESVVGQDVTVDHSNDNNTNTARVTGVTTDRSVERTRNVTEWHIFFHAKGSPASVQMPTTPQIQQTGAIVSPPQQPPAPVMPGQLPSQPVPYVPGR
jgi:hypothetical protein